MGNASHAPSIERRAREPIGVSDGILAEPIDEVAMTVFQVCHFVGVYGALIDCNK